jgi:hypothetical protein
VFTSTDPTGGASAWTKSAIPVIGNLAAVSCPSVSLCIAADGDGNILISTDPTAGASTWTKTSVAQPTPTGNAITTVSCPSVSLCIGAGADGAIFTSADPTGGANTWTSAPVDIPGCAPQSRPCQSEQLYVSDDQGIRVLDHAPPGVATSIGNVALDGDSLLLSWTHDGAPRQLELR